MDPYSLAFLYLLFTLKHTVCDLALQKLEYSDKSRYFSAAANRHYQHHGIGSLLVGFTVGWQYAILVAILDYIIHWQIDYCKTIIKKRLELTERDYGFWVLQTADQALHFATYFLFVVIAITWYLQ